MPGAVQVAEIRHLQEPVVRREAEIHHLQSPMVGHENEIRWLRGARAGLEGEICCLWSPVAKHQGEIGCLLAPLAGQAGDLIPPSAGVRTASRENAKCEKRKETRKSPEGERVQRKLNRCRKMVDPTSNCTQSGIVCWNPNG
jgi:hypothetical protein